MNNELMQKIYALIILCLGVAFITALHYFELKYDQETKVHHFLEPLP
jgi:hypothetical protein